MSTQKSPIIKPNASKRFTIGLRRQHEVKLKIHRIATDYLVNLNFNDFVKHINDIGIDSNLELIPKTAITLSFDRGDNEREEIANLIIRLVNDNYIQPEDVSKCFRMLLVRIDDLRLDVPNVIIFLEYFVNRFIDNKVMNYGDSTNFIELLSIYSGSSPRKTIKKIVEKIFNQYFISEQLEECCKEIEEIKEPEAHPLIIKYAVSFSLDRNNHERELISRFFTAIVEDESKSNFIKRSELEEGFLVLLNSIEDLYEDVPYVYHYLSFFISRAINDDCLAPSFLIRAREKIGGDAHIVLEYAKELLSSPDKEEEMIKIWDSNVEDLAQLKSIVKKNVTAFFDSDGDAAMFHRFMQQLGHPHFHYQVVFQLINVLLDRDRSFIDSVADLIVSFYNLGYSTEHEIVKGLLKVRNRLPELKIDVLDAEEVYEKVRSKVLTGKK